MLFWLCNKFSNNMPQEKKKKKNIYFKITRVSSVLMFFFFNLLRIFVSGLFFLWSDIYELFFLLFLFSFLDYHNPLALRFIFSRGYLIVYHISRFIKFFSLGLIFYYFQGNFFIAFFMPFLLLGYITYTQISARLLNV